MNSIFSFFGRHLLAAIGHRPLRGGEMLQGSDHPPTANRHPRENGGMTARPPIAGVFLGGFHARGFIGLQHK